MYIRSSFLTSTPLHMAAQQGNLEVAKALVEANDALSDITNNFGQTAYDIALEKGYMSVANYLSTA